MPWASAEPARVGMCPPDLLSGPALRFSPSPCSGTAAHTCSDPRNLPACTGPLRVRCPTAPPRAPLQPFPVLPSVVPLSAPLGPSPWLLPAQAAGLPFLYWDHLSLKPHV